MKIDSITLNTPKNIVQYLIGFGLYLLVYGSFDPLKLILGISSFIIAYAAIYPYNDLMDLEEDKKDDFKKAYKALVRGDLSKQKAITLVFGLPIIGLLIASMVSFWYTFMLMILLFLNFLYSSPYTRLKKKKSYAVLSIFAMQSIKFSLGWLTFTTDLTLLPSWIITTLSLAYIFGYILYKKNVIDMKKTMKENLKIMIPLSVAVVFSYVVSLLIYPFKLPLLIVFPLAFVFLSMQKQKNVVKKTFTLSNMTVAVLAAIAVTLLLLNVPFIGLINEGTSDAIDKLGEFTLERVNDETYDIICTINASLYNYPIRDLTELDSFLNVSSREVVLRED